MILKGDDPDRGRAFFATSDRLGEYVLMDFVRTKRRAVS